MKSLSDKIYELKGNLSYREMSEHTGISHNYLSNLVKGVDPRTGQEIQPSIDTLKKLATSFADKTTISELMELADYITPDDKKRLSHKQSLIVGHIDDELTNEQLHDIIRYINLIKLQNKIDYN